MWKFKQRSGQLPGNEFELIRTKRISLGFIDESLCCMAFQHHEG